MPAENLRRLIEFCPRLVRFASLRIDTQKGLQGSGRWIVLNRLPRRRTLQSRDLIFRPSHMHAAAVRLQVFLEAGDAIARLGGAPSMFIPQRENAAAGIVGVLVVGMLLQKCFLGCNGVGNRRLMPVAVGHQVAGAEEGRHPNQRRDPQSSVHGNLLCHYTFMAAGLHSGAQ
jgi:hypothetical protein